MSNGTAIQQFTMPESLGDYTIRVVTLDGDPWFVAADVCAVLGIVNARDAMGRLDDDEYRQVNSTVVSTDGGPARHVVNESGLYSLILGSRKPEARAFKRWVTSEVLPAIRKTGTYALSAPSSPLDMLRQQAAANLAILDTMIGMQVDQRALTARVDALEGNYGRITALAYAKLNGLRDGVTYLNALGRAASGIGRRDCIPVEKAHSTIFGTVNTWPVEVWDEALTVVGR